MTPPAVSVLMPVCNEEKYIHEAIQSILNQTYTDFELILVDDGSTDSTPGILADYASGDSRVVLVKNDTNQGLIYTLNRGLGMARGKYIARFDANDVSLPERLALQVNYMEQHPEVGALGTNFKYIDTEGQFMNQGRPKDTRPVTPNIHKWMLLWRCSIYHTTVTIRRAVLEHTGLNYDPAFRHAEDFDLWTRISKYSDIASLPQVLVHVRITPTGISTIYFEKELDTAHEIIRRELISLLGVVKSNETLETLIGVFKGRKKDDTSKEYIGASDLLFLVYQRFCEQALSDADRKQIQADVASRLIKIANEACEHSFRDALLILSKLRYIQPASLISFHIAKQIFWVFLKSLGISGYVQRVILQRSNK